MKAYKFVSSRFVLGLMAVFLAVSMAGCAATAPPLDDTAASVATTTTTATADTSPTETEAETATKSSEETQGMTATTTEATSAPRMDQTEASTESQTQNTNSMDSVATTTQTTAPPETDPPETAPAHNHNYQKTDTVPVTCTTDGYTVYECSCGSSYTDDYVSATGHSWGEWATTKDPTSSAEGEKTRTCSGCGAVETASIEKLPAEQIDTAALEAYGRQYAANTYGYEPVIGTRAGYYPGWTVYIDSMEKGRAEVAECVDAMTDQLVASGVSIVVIIDGQECAAMMDIEIVHEGDNQYCVWLYYG